MPSFSVRVTLAALASATARRLELDPRRRQDLVWGALLHDLGKLGVPESVLERPAGERTPEERAVYEGHPELGRRILGPIASLRRAVEIVAALELLLLDTAYTCDEPMWQSTPTTSMFGRLRARR